MLNLDGTLSDEELKKAATDKGIIAPEDIEARLADLKRDAMDAGFVIWFTEVKLLQVAKWPKKFKQQWVRVYPHPGFASHL